MPRSWTRAGACPGQRSGYLGLGWPRWDFSADNPPGIETWPGFPGPSRSHWNWWNHLERQNEPISLNSCALTPWVRSACVCKGLTYCMWPMCFPHPTLALPGGNSAPLRGLRFDALRVDPQALILGILKAFETKLIRILRVGGMDGWGRQF